MTVFNTCYLHRILSLIGIVQESLNDHNAMLKVLPHLSKNGDDIVREVLAFLAAMLFAGNEAVQVRPLSATIFE